MKSKTEEKLLEDWDNCIDFTYKGLKPPPKHHPKEELVFLGHLTEINLAIMFCSKCSETFLTNFEDYR